jgi:hypothetical protein
MSSSAEDKAEENTKAEIQREAAKKARTEKHKVDLEDMKARSVALQERIEKEIVRVKEEHEKFEAESIKEIGEVQAQAEQEQADITAEIARSTVQHSEMFAASEASLSEATDNEKKWTSEADKAESEIQKLQPQLVEAKKVIVVNAQLHKDLQREQGGRKRLHNELTDMRGRVRVMVRARPLPPDDPGIKAIVQDGRMSMVVKLDSKNKKVYDFDVAFDGSESNDQLKVYSDMKTVPLSLFDGYNVNIFTAGSRQTGKSHTLFGDFDQMSVKGQAELPPTVGIAPRVIDELIRLLTSRNAAMRFKIELVMLQVQGDSIFDLLAWDPSSGTSPTALDVLDIGDPSICNLGVTGASGLALDSVNDAAKIYTLGTSRRAPLSAALTANVEFSHLIVSFRIGSTNRRIGEEIFSNLTLIELAAPIFQNSSDPACQSVNLSLGAIQAVIRTLSGAKEPSSKAYSSHVLTRLLSGVMDTNSKNVLFLNVASSPDDVVESNQVLSFGTKCKEQIGSSVAPALQAQQMAELKKELAKLKMDEKEKKKKAAKG